MISSTRPTQALPIADKPLQYLPVSMFGSVMGLTGLSAAWHLTQQQFGCPAWIPELIGAMAVLAFVILTCAYAVKIIAAPSAARAEFDHPIAGNLFGTFFISLLLLPIVLAPVSLMLAQVIWVIGVVGMILFAWRMVIRWTSMTQLPTHATPAWIIPVVGLLDIPIAAPALSLPALHGVMVFGLAVGLFFALPIFTLVFARLLFEENMPPLLQPSLMILVAPFAVGTSAYMVVSDRVDLFAQSLYMIMLFLLVVMAVKLRHLLRCCPFRLGWWAVSFPLAASAIAALRIAASEHNRVSDVIALVILLCATAVIAWMTLRTLVGVVKGELQSLVA